VIAAFSLALALAAGPAPADAEKTLGFADWLYDQGDYYRAIGEYKRYLYLAGSAADSDEVNLKIARSYAKGGRVDEAVGMLSALADRDGASPRLRTAAVFEQGYARYKAKEWELAAAAFSRYASFEKPEGGPGLGRGGLLLGFAMLRAGAPTENAADAFAEAVKADATLREPGEELRLALADIDAAPHRSPAVAGVLAALVPGLGHVYNGEVTTGLAAFIWNAAFIFGVVDSFRHGQLGAGVVLLVVESLWYGGAVFGAIAGAYRYNRDARLNRVEALENRFRWIVDLTPVPGGAAVKVGLSY
jgi:tetratricopeptide (TPR) repeat protein